jgi:cytochrome P450
MNVASSDIPRYSESHWLGSLPAFRASRVQFQLDVMRECPDIAKVRLGIFDVITVGSPELAREVLVNQADAFVKSYGLSLFARPLLGDGLLTSEHALHRRQRRLIAPPFVQRQVVEYADLMSERAEQAVTRMLAREDVEIGEQAMQVTLEIVGKTLFGSEVQESSDEVGRAVTEAMECIMSSMTSTLPVPPFVPTATNRTHVLRHDWARAGVATNIANAAGRYAARLEGTCLISATLDDDA